MAMKTGKREPLRWLGLAVTALCACGILQSQTQQEMKVTVAAGYTSPTSAPSFLRLVPAPGVLVDKTQEWHAPAGAGHLAERTYTIHYKESKIKPVEGMHVIWSDLIAHSDADTVRRLTEDPEIGRAHV